MQEKTIKLNEGNEGREKGREFTKKAGETTEKIKTNGKEKQKMERRRQNIMNRWKEDGKI